MDEQAAPTPPIQGLPPVIDLRDRLFGFALLAVSAVVTVLATLNMFGSDWMKAGMGVAMLSMLGGVELLQRSTCLPRSSWRRRAWALWALLPIFVFLATVRIVHGPVDGNAALTARELPGYRVSLPKWATKRSGSEYWMDNYSVEKGRNMVRVGWSAGTPNPDDPDMAWMVQTVFSSLEGKPVTAAGKETLTIAGHPEQTSYFRLDDYYIAVSQFDCKDGRIGQLYTLVEKLETAELLHRRVAQTIECVATTAPKLLLPEVDLPDFTREEVEGGVTYGNQTEGIFLGVGNPNESVSANFKKDPKFRKVLLDLLAPNMGVTVGGELKLAAGSNVTYLAPITFDEDSSKGFAALMVLYCPDKKQSFFGLHIGPDSTAGAKRLAAVRCPK